MNYSPKIEPEYFDLKGLARYSSLSVGTLRAILSRPGGPPHFRPGGKVLIRRSDWDHWLEQFKTAPVDLDALVAEVMSGLRK